MTKGGPKSGPQTTVPRKSTHSGPHLCVFQSFCSCELAMLVLYETAMGFALFKLTDSAKLTDPDLYKEFETPEKANGLCV